MSIAITGDWRDWLVSVDPAKPTPPRRNKLKTEEVKDKDLIDMIIVRNYGI